jgi:hypothetical protein
MKRYAYFIQGETTRMIKIGSSEEPLRRIRELRTGSGERLLFLGCLPPEFGRGDLERWCHDEFLTERSHGEWFHPSDTLRRFIAQNAVGWDGETAFPPLPEAGVVVPTRSVWWKRLPVVDVEAIRDSLGAA